jgi:hypothetical protein
MQQVEMVAATTTTMEGEGPKASDVYRFPLSKIGYVSALYVRSFQRQPTFPQ